MQYQLYFTKLGDFTWKVSECEELVGDTHRLVDQENPYLDHYHMPHITQPPAIKRLLG